VYLPAFLLILTQSKLLISIIAPCIPTLQVHLVIGSLPTFI